AGHHLPDPGPAGAGGRPRRELPPRAQPVPLAAGGGAAAQLRRGAGQPLEPAFVLEGGAVSWLAEFHLLRPWWLLAALPALLLTLALWRSRGVDAGWRRAIDPSLLPHLLEAEGGSGDRSRWLLLLAGWLLAV